jgi:hypothetical protein
MFFILPKGILQKIYVFYFGMIESYVELLEMK